MSIIDWYSGTDSNGVVPSVIEAVMKRMDNRTADDSDVEKLNRILELEGNQNWQGYILGLIGLIKINGQDLKSAKMSFQRAIGLFKITADDFDQVSNVHCQCCYSLGTILFDEGEVDSALTLFQKCLPRMNEVYGEIFIGNIFMFIDLCLSARKDYSTAVTFSENAIVATNASVDALESLMISQFNAEMFEDSLATYSRILEKCNDRDTLDRVKKFAQRNLRDSIA